MTIPWKTATSKKIWVLGADVASADRSISWNQEMPNLSNCDILVIDPNSRSVGMGYNDTEIRDYLRTMIIAQKHVIVILPIDTSQLQSFLWNALPVTPELIQIKPCAFKDIYFVNDEEKQINPEIVEYVKYVESSTFIINSIDYIHYFWKYLKSDSFGVEKYSFSHSLGRIAKYRQYNLTNVNNQIIGLPVSFSLMDNNNNELHETGTIVFLPPPTKNKF